MHQHYRAFRARDQAHHLGIVGQGGDVVDNRGTRIERDPCNRRAPGIDRKRNPEPLTEPRQHLGYPLQLDLDRDFVRTDRTGRLATDIDQVGAGSFHRERMLDGAVRIEIAPAVRE